MVLATKRALTFGGVGSKKYARLAQWIEHLSTKQGVESSSLSVRTTILGNQAS